MQIQIRKSSERGHFDMGWLDTYHTFSFAEYYDPNFMAFRELRVINEDRVQPGEGFPTHSHRDMEIITYVLAGTLEHKDSMGTGSVIRPGDVQYMSAGSGVTHSEYNGSKKEIVHLLQIWIMPDKKSAEPRYGQKQFPDSEKKNRLRLIASSDGRDGSLAIRQKVDVYASLLDANQKIDWQGGRDGWVQLIKGSLSLNGKQLKAGDGAAVTEIKDLQFKAEEKAEFLFFVFA
jgi:redox-sensitive bicupin YhaK (pirin superfamily)